MQVEVGNIVEGKITGITNFGAFVALPDNLTGMVHISEISNSYVKEISEYLSENQVVKVKVLSIAEDGKIGLSMKQCEEKKADAPREGYAKSERSGGPRGNNRPPQQRRNQPSNWQAKQADSSTSFEDMMTKFKQVSNDRMGELKRSNEPKRSRRGGGTPK